MARYRLIHEPTGHAAAAVTQAQNWWTKGWGVLGRPSLAIGEGLWLPGVASVHTLGVRFPLDLLFLNENFSCVCLMPQFPPGRWMAHGPGACHTVELGAGTLAAHAAEARLGDRWLLERLPGALC